MSGYIKLCLDTWRQEFTLLNYDNLNNYTNLDIKALQNYTIAQISDIVRVHILRDNGGYWVDADTIMLTDYLPEENMIGMPSDRTAHCGYLHFDKNATMLKEWAEKQDMIISSGSTGEWDLFANSLSDPLVKKYDEVTIKDRQLYFPESYMSIENNPYCQYRDFYFDNHYQVSDIKPTELLMLHNSWTPSWYKDLSEIEVLTKTRTMSNILKEVL
jgi:hypothetical protein